MKKIKNQKTRKSCRRKLKIQVFCWQNQQIEFSHTYIEVLAVGDLWMLLLKFPAQSRTITNTRSGRLSLVHIGKVVPYTAPLCRQGTFLHRKHSSFFLSLPFLSKKPAPMTIFWSCVLPQIWDSDYATALPSYTDFQFYLFIAEALGSGVPTAV